MNAQPKNDPLSEFSYKIDKLRARVKVAIDATESVMKEIDGVQIIQRADTWISFTYCGREFGVKCHWLSGGEQARITWFEVEYTTESNYQFRKLDVATVDKRDNIVEKGEMVSACGEITYQIIRKQIALVVENTAYPFVTVPSVH